MPLKATKLQTPGEMAVLNRWADTIEERLNNLKTTVVKKQANITLKTNNVANPTQSVLNIKAGSNISLATDPFGALTITGLAGGDGLTHGVLPWEYDPAYIILRDDFPVLFNGNTTTPSAGTWGQLGWTFTNTSGIATPKVEGGNPPYIGQVTWENVATPSQYSALILGSTTAGIAQLNPNSWALLENPGWKMTFIFKVDGAESSSPTFISTKKSLYIGLIGAAWSAVQTAATSARPDYFIGLRYDTSASPGTLTLSSVNTASGGTTVYNGTITGGTNGAFIGLTFTISGFTTGANNGTFICVNSSSTTLTLQNAGGVAETHAATASASGLNDTFFTFEAVQNQQFTSAARHNAQGQTFVTNVSPTAGTWHRLDIVCSTAGVVKLTLDGSATNTVTFTIPQVTVTSTASGQVSVTNGIGRFAPIQGTTGTQGKPPFSSGSVVTLSGLTGGNAALNSTWTLFGTDGGTNYSFDATGVSNIANNSTAFTMVGYASYAPFACYGNDDTTGPPGASMRFFIDYFSFVWNPNLGPSAPGTPNSLKPRYW